MENTPAHMGKMEDSSSMGAHSTTWWRRSKKAVRTQTPNVASALTPEISIRPRKRS